MGEDIFDCIELPIYFSMFSSNDLSDFKMLMASRVIGGLGCGMIFTLLPTYMKELLNIKNSSSEIVDILITQFGLGICLQMFRLTVRASKEQTTTEVCNLLADQF